MTAAELRAQDIQVLLTLTPRQRAAVDRRDEARRHARFAGQTLDERMDAICARDAAKLTPTGRANPLDALFGPKAA